ncbi:hypothetical protein Mpet_0805 [Methanolacinia petrolearia DSM 11571]|uniref:Uncharacterized protein n=1 Tax=Methanolacinia petrolearia (strain DSM 11571 / OCM 486 / SEBR 4847) TaxID=679926 RepID=E1RIZ1_METP4|nr:hypothetical protein [Methanolacinia petrolearia]ADN35579.1 hypothetical protein Mpet_0805 [Methanolacinia petrolearia DSM 11571]
MVININRIKVWIFIGLLIGATVFFSGCVFDEAPNSPGNEYSVQTPPSTIARPPSLFINASSIKPSFLSGETVEVDITFRNTDEDPVVIDSFPPEIILSNPTSGIVRNYPCGSDTITLEPGESIDYILKWDQRDSDGDGADPGIYLVKVSDVSYYENGAKKVIFPEGADIASVIIEYPQGAIEGEIFVHHSEKLNGYLVTLENITFTPTVSTIYIVLHSVDNSFFRTTDQTNTPLPTPPAGLNPLGYYRIDDGPEKEFTCTGYRVVDETIVLLWDFEPVPTDVGELHFVITSLGDWEGYCEIHVDVSNSTINLLSV